MKSKQITIPVLCFLSLFCTAQEKKPKKNFARVVAGPALSLYQNNTEHTTGTKPRPAFFAGIYEDIKMYRDFSFLPGVEYFYHGLSFDSYYFANGYDFLYDKSYHYNYSLTMQETRLSLGFKQIIGMETRNPVTGYLSSAFVLRYLLNANLDVNSNLTGSQLFTGNPGIVFEHPVFQKDMASAVKFGAGVQRNYFKTHRAWFFEFNLFFPLSRFYINQSFTPASLYINSSFLQLGLGLKF